ncbi:Short-chain dehydrogenase [Candidatus Rhodobacter oscarellae]|uniref:Short-chain dehydrogenase n=1 Tax=Candidatus Rhodobacter oscarellae TaxID=1675527 RepID=A0A0J9E928_9RHOB|nr:SDR family NAD(P)-dependent oxidoreductase [Candidatus Rhodobacter lobularis]KMW58169.1 Short-chain dehydrogenase [Candidatus Rhodobacter lobularis]
MKKPIAVLIGVGDGLSASLARALAPDYALVLAARSSAKMAPLAEECGAETVEMDASDPAAMAALFAGLPTSPQVAVYNPSARVRGPLVDLEPEEVRRAVEVTAYGAFLMGQQAAKRMLEGEMQGDRRGTILFTGASAGVKGFPQSASFAMGKFAQRGLAQSMARELHPQGIHVAWVNIDGGIRNPSRPERVDATGKPDSMLDPDAIAREYLNLINQDRTAWSEELNLRPWVERF